MTRKRTALRKHAYFMSGTTSLPVMYPYTFHMGGKGQYSKGMAWSGSWRWRVGSQETEEVNIRKSSVFLQVGSWQADISYKCLCNLTM